MQILPVSAVVPTMSRPRLLQRTLASLENQNLFPAELIVVDASDDETTREMLNAFPVESRVSCSLRWIPAHARGAAVQRNQGVAAATQPAIWFFDDDILFEPECVARLWRALQSDPGLGGVNAMIVNQRYQPPGLCSRLLFRAMHGRSEGSFAGRVIGPAMNLLPEDREDLPEVVAVDWLNTTCTIYRREALPSSPFDSFFVGYSMMEDLALSLTVGKKWKLANVRTARIHHDSQPREDKNNNFAFARMELINRHYVMTQILERRQLSDYLKLLLFELFGLGASLTTLRGPTTLPSVLFGKFAGVGAIITSKTRA